MSSSSPQETRPKRALTTAEELLCGVAGGLGKVITGHPFDTVKSRVQSGAFATSREALSQTFKHEGLGAFYQGVLPPCVSVGIVSGTLFYVNARIRTALQPDPTQRLTYAQMAIAGGGAGAATALVLTPLDQMKLWLQVEQRSGGAAAAAAGSATTSTSAYGGHLRRVATKIGTPQLYRGWAATTLREVGTFGIFFPTNEALKLAVGNAVGHDASTGEPLPIHWRLAAAGVSGVLCWLPCYPIDQIKSRQQLQGHPLLEPQGKPIPAWSGKTMAAVADTIWRTEGVQGFTRGIAPCLLRAFPTYAAQFVIFDTLTGWLKTA